VAEILQSLLKEKGLQALAAPRMGELLLQKNRICLSLREVKAWQAVWFSLEHPSLVRIALLAQRERPIPWEHRYWGIRWFLKTAGLSRFLRRHLTTGEVAVFDEGLTHRAVTLFASDQESPDADTVAHYVRLLPVPDVLIRVYASPELCVQRLRGRAPMLRLRNRDPEAIVPFVKHQFDTIQLIMSEAERCGWPLISIDNTASLIGLEQQLRSGWSGYLHDLF